MPMERAESDVVLLFLTNIRIRISRVDDKNLCLMLE